LRGTWYTPVSTSGTMATSAPTSARVAAGDPHRVTATTARTTHPAVVPSSASMNSGVGAWRLIDCIAAMPAGGGIRRSPLITNVEKAKNTPATSPLPTAHATVSQRANPEVMVEAAAVITPPPQPTGPGRRRDR
jgi:hypothetical protein